MFKTPMTCPWVLCLVLIFFSCQSLAQQPFYGHRFSSGMVYSTIRRGSEVDNRRTSVLSGVNIKTPPVSPVSRHYVLAGGLTLTVNSTGTTCEYSNGSFEVTASGGNPPYQYSENGYPYQSSGSFTEKAAGTYNVTVKDASGTMATATVVLTNTYLSPTASVQSYTNPTGCAMMNGSIVLSATGGTPPYRFNNADLAYGNSNTFHNLGTGDYILGVQDQNGCVGKTEILLGSSCPMQINGYGYSELICAPNTGEIEISYVSGGTAPYQYSIDGVHYQTSNDLTGLGIGQWTAYAKDATGLVTSVTFSIGYYCSLSVSLITTDATCGNSDGTISATGANGSEPYTYSIDGVNFQASGVFGGLAAGTYTVTVKDANDRTNYSNAIVYDGCPKVTATVTDETCDQANGIIQAAGQSGTAPYLFSIDGINFTSNNVFTGLSHGSYTLTIKDVNGVTASTSCTIDNVCVTVSATPVDETCGKGNGKIIASGSGGTPPYQYSINGADFQPSGVFPGLVASTYTVTIKDASNLTNQTVVTLGNMTGPSFGPAEISSASCSNNDGMVTIHASGGLAPLIYSLNGADFQPGPVFDKLANATYTIVVKDANGCIDEMPATVPLLNKIVVDAGNGATICEGKSAALSATTNAETFSWQTDASLSDVHSLTPVVKPAVTTTYYLMGNWGACQATASVTINVMAAPVADAGNDITTCYGKDVVLQGSGGTHFQWTPSLYLNDPASSSPEVEHPVQSLSYSLTVGDDNGCWSIIPAKVDVTVTPPAVISIGYDTSIAVGEPLTLHVTDVNGSGFSDFAWTPAEGLDNSLIADPTLIPARIDTYVYTVTAKTSSGCEAEGSISIKVYQQADIFVPNAFTPNGDGHNDILRATPVGIRQFQYFAVYNRWGQLVFRTSDPGSGWDGRMRGNSGNNDTFVWMAEGIDYGGKTVRRRGSVILIR